ncbi:MAG TPA: carbohydrate-binding family 9-like protein [Bacteroidales bacterium]|nr:carbohydrate-binding family 9-like protein [Bacteroidales bacterium]
MRRKFFIGVLLHFTVSEICVLTAQKIYLPERTSYVIYRTAEEMKIDGKTEEKNWLLAPWTSWFQDIEGDVHAQVPRFRTRVKMLWDDEYLHVFAELEESDLWATITQRDAVIFHDNDFEIFIDPDGDTHYYYEIELNAFNTVWDLFLSRPYRDGARPLTSWNLVGLKTAVSLQGTLNNPNDRDTSWTVEIAIPFRGLTEYSWGGKPRSGDQWRLNFSRVEWKTTVVDVRYVKETDPATGKPCREDNWVWSPIGAVDMHRPERWGFVQFSDILAGHGVQPFFFDPENEVKDELRKLYYAQREYALREGHYASSLRELKKSQLLFFPLAFNPELKSTFTLYEIIASRTNSSWQWHIDQSGRVWCTKGE